MSKGHVLIVEDEKGIAETHELRLGADFETTIALSGAEALEILAEESDNIDVVLLDRRMPEMSGDEVADSIRERGYDCGVAMVTAVEPDFDILQFGFDDYATKPVDGDELQQLVERLLSHANYDKKVRRHLGLVAKKIALEEEKADSELANNEEYEELKRKVHDSRSKLKESVKGDVFVELLLRESGPNLNLVLSYDDVSWRFRYVSGPVEEKISTMDEDFNHVLDQFREEGRERTALSDSLALDGYTCSLHLFENQLFVNVPRTDTTDFLCAFDPVAAPNLTEFVSTVDPYVD